MDAFYASVEQREDVKLKGKPVAVGGSSDRGVVAAASYEARKFGVHSAMPSKIAIRKCPDLIFVKPRFELYRNVSRQIRNIFKDFTDTIEPLSLDEAFLDVSINKKSIPSATLVAKEIKSLVKNQTELTASAGISFNKFLAKIASDIKKPDGLTVITPEKADAFIDKLSVEKFHGVGKVTTKKMHVLGIRNGADLKTWKKTDLIKHFGKVGGFYFDIVRGIDNRPVEANRIRKSVGAENTYEKDITDPEELKCKISASAEKVFKWMKKNNTYGKTVTIKIKYNDFQQITRSHTGSALIDSEDLLLSQVLQLLESNLPEKPVRLMGVSVSNLKGPSESDVQLTIDFDNHLDSFK